jgi:hypothetical protein
MSWLMSGTERKPNRREFLKRSFFNIVVIGAGMEGARIMTAKELQKQTNLQLDQAERIVNDALVYASRVEKYNEEIKALIPSVVVRFYSPSKETSFRTLGFYDVTASMISENDEFLDKLSEAVSLLEPPSFLISNKIDLVIQNVKLPDKPKKPSSLTMITEPNSFLGPDRIN